MPSNGIEWIEASCRFLSCDDVTHATDGANELLIGIPDFISQMPDIDVDDVRCTGEALVPDMINNHISRENPIGICHQVFQKSVLFRCKLDSFSGSADLLSQPV